MVIECGEVSVELMLSVGDISTASIIRGYEITVILSTSSD
jgi:hypothetical protein